MGFYIEVPEDTQKAEQIRDIYGGEIIPVPQSFSEVQPGGRVLIITVSNGLWEGAGIIFDANEFAAFTRPNDPRPRKALLLDRDVAIKLNPHVAPYLCHVP